MRGSMESCLRAAVEQAMKVQEVILRAMAKKITWFQSSRDGGSECSGIYAFGCGGAILKSSDSRKADFWIIAGDCQASGVFLWRGGRGRASFRLTREKS